MCELCGKSFTSSQYLKYHKHAEHFKELGLKPYQCDKCQKLLKDPSALRYHMLSQHEKKFRFKCTFCDRGFNQQSALKKHVQCHTGEKPFECDVCKRRFRAASALKCHVNTHTGFKPHKCKFCGRGFAQLYKKKRHEEVHENDVNKYVCLLCSKGFPVSDYLTLHMRNVHDQRSFTKLVPVTNLGSTNASGSGDDASGREEPEPWDPVASSWQNTDYPQTKASQVQIHSTPIHTPSLYDNLRDQPMENVHAKIHDSPAAPHHFTIL